MYPASLKTAVRGAYGVFSVQFANPNELTQGTNVVDAAKAAGVRHLVYSSVGGAESQNGFYREHGWGPIEKWQIERPPRPHGFHRLAQPNRQSPAPGPTGVHVGLTDALPPSAARMRLLPAVPLAAVMLGVPALLAR